MKKKISFALPDLIERIGTKYNNGVFKCKIVFLPPCPGDKNFQEARNKGGRIRDRRSIVRNLLLPSPPAIIIPRRHPRVEAESLFLSLLSRREKSNRRREERDRKRGGNENRKERRGSRGIYDDPRVSNSNSKPLLVSHSLSRSLAAVEIAWANERLYWPVHNDIRGHVAACSATISRGEEEESQIIWHSWRNKMFFLLDRIVEIVIQV